MNTQNLLGDSESWARALASGDIEATLMSAHRNATPADLAFIVAAAGSSGCRTASKVKMLEMKYGFTTLPDNALFKTDTRDLSAFDPKISSADFLHCSLDAGLFEAWLSHPHAFKDKRGATHGPRWFPDADSSGVRLISAVGNAIGYQAAAIFEDELHSRQAHLLSKSSAGNRDLAFATIEFPGGTGTGLTPHVRDAMRRACAEDDDIALHLIRFLVLPTDVAEPAVKVNAQESIMQLALETSQPQLARPTGTVFCISPNGPRRILDSSELEGRVALISWTAISGETGILSALLAELANVEAASTKDERGLTRALSFAGVGMVDGGLFEAVQALTLELVIRVAKHIYGCEPADVEPTGGSHSLPVPYDSGGPPDPPVPSVESGGERIADATPDASQRSHTPGSRDTRRQHGTRAGERARRLHRELATVPLVAADWTTYAAAGMTRAEERRLRGECFEAVDQDYRHGIRMRLREVLPAFAARYRDALVGSLSVGGIPEGLRQIRNLCRDLEAEIAAVPRPRISVTAEYLEQHERDVYKGRRLRRRMKGVQAYLDDAARVIRYQAVLLALRTIKNELSRIAGTLSRYALDAQPMMRRAEGMRQMLNRSRRERSDPHVVPVLGDEQGERAIRHRLAGELLAFTPMELLRDVRSEDDGSIALRIEREAPSDVLGDLAAHLATKLRGAARGLSVGEIVLETYQDGSERLKTAVAEALRRSLEVGSYRKERNGQAIRRLIFIAHTGSQVVDCLIEEELKEQGCLTDRSERPTCPRSSGIHFFTVETAVSPACLMPACRGGSWHIAWLERQNAFDSGEALNPAARDSVVLAAVRRHRILQRLDAAYVEEARWIRKKRTRSVRGVRKPLREGEAGFHSENRLPGPPPSNSD